MIGAYAVHDEAQQKFALVLAADAVASSRLVKRAGEKWGENAEIAVAHACFTDCRADDAVAQTVVQGDHATVTFKTDAISPLLLVCEQGRWLIDVQGYIQLLGPDLPQAIKDSERFFPIANSAEDQLSKGTYNSPDALVADLNKQLQTNP